MSWTCPICSKQFRNENQWHSCAITGLDKHLANKPEQIIEAYNKIMSEVSKFGEIHVNPVKTSIQIKARANFLSLKPKKQQIEMEFQLGRECNEGPVYRTVRISGKRVLHFAAIDNINDIDTHLIDLLKESFDLVSKAG